jgi:hypothetical protein
MPFASVVLKSFLVVGRIFCRLVNVYFLSPSLVLSTPSIDSHTLMSFRAGHHFIHELVPFLRVPRDFVAYRTFVVTQPPWSLLLHLIPIVNGAILTANGAPKVAFHHCRDFLFRLLFCSTIYRQCVCSSESPDRSTCASIYPTL